jgi:hypothetical protein
VVQHVFKLHLRKNMQVKNKAPQFSEVKKRRKHGSF